MRDGDEEDLTFPAGVNGFVAIAESCDAGGAFFRGSIDGLKKDFKSKFLILLGHLGEAGLIDSEAFFPPLFPKYFFSGHLEFLIHPHPRPLPSRERGKRGGLSSCSRVISYHFKSP